MNARPAYDRDPFLRSLRVEVIALGQAKGSPFVLLDDTLCYPEGGGQPADQGFLGATRILDVQKVAGEIRHVLEHPLPLGPQLLHLDWERRFDHMQQHTGQHLLTAVAQDRFGWETTAFHLGAERCDIEVATSSPSSADLLHLEDSVAEEIRKARPVKAQWVDAETYAQRKVRSRGLPEGHAGDLRLVEIEGLDLNTCGGTHLSNTAELECLVLLGQEPIRGGTRLFFAAGSRVRRRMAEHERRNAEFRTRLGAPDAELGKALEGKLDQLQASQRQVRKLEEELCVLRAEALAGKPEARLEQHFEGRDAAFLQQLGRALFQAAPGKAAFFTCQSEGQAAFLLVGGPEAPCQASTLGPEIAQILGGRGGGSQGLFQGKAASLAQRSEALARFLR